MKKLFTTLLIVILLSTSRASALELSIGQYEPSETILKWDEFSGLDDVETYNFSQPDYESIRQWIGYSDCGGCGATQKKQIFAIDTIAGNTYKLRVVPGYVSSTLAYNAAVTGGTITAGASKAWSVGYKSLPDVWEIVFVASGTQASVQIGNIAWGGSSYMYFDVIYLEEVQSPNITVEVWETSFYLLDASGNMVLDGSGFPIEGQGVYYFQRAFAPQTTALIVMDAFADIPNVSPFLIDYYNAVVEDKIIPLVDEFSQRGYPIILLTNDPAVTGYATVLHPGLMAYVSTGDAVVIYHQSYTPATFANYFGSRGITNLIYTGFASNVCVIGRQNTGMIVMANWGMKNYFVPGASAAVERPDTWTTGAVHIEATNMISQWIGKIIEYEDLLAALE